MKNIPLERTLAILKPDSIKRGLVGEIVNRIENSGMKIIGMKMTWIDEEFAKKHYFDVSERRGKKVLDLLLKFITSGPVIVFCIEGVEAVENIRRLVGSTEPKSAQPGTIRGDYAHISYMYANEKEIGIQNLIHASGSSEEAKYEVALWFKENELFEYQTAYEDFVF